MASGFITKASIITKTPMLCMSTSWLGPFYIPNKSACYFCLVNDKTMKPIVDKSKNNFRVDKRAFGPIIAMTCSLAVLEAVQFLSKICKPKTIDGIYIIDPFQMDKTRFIDICASSTCQCYQDK